MTYQVRQGPGSDLASMDLSKALNEWMEKHGPEGLYRTCANCRFMEREQAAFCHKFRLTPPVVVIMAGCPEHDDDCEVPF